MIVHHVKYDNGMTRRTPFSAQGVIIQEATMICSSRMVYIKQDVASHRVDCQSNLASNLPSGISFNIFSTMSKANASIVSLLSNTFDNGEDGWDFLKPDDFSQSREDRRGSTVTLSSSASSLHDGHTVSDFAVISKLDAISSYGSGSPSPSVSSSAGDNSPTIPQPDVLAPLIELFQSLEMFRDSEGGDSDRFQSLRVKLQQHTQQSLVTAANTYSTEIDDLGKQIVSMSSIGDRTSIFIVTAIGLHGDQNQWSETVTNMHQTRERTVAAMEDRPVKDVLAKLRYMSSDGKGWTASQENAGWFIDQINKGHPEEEPDRYMIFGLIVHSAKVAEQKIAQPSN